MFWVILLLSLALALLAAYTMSMQKTTLNLGRQLVGESGAGTGVQDAITPKSQTTRNIAMFILLIITFAITTYTYAWYHGLWVVLACLIGSQFIKTLLGIQPGSPRLVSAVINDMKLRHQAYLNAGDTMRAKVIEELINKSENLSHEEIKNEAKR